jgi:hypothetical protein
VESAGGIEGARNIGRNKGVKDTRGTGGPDVI